MSHEDIQQLIQRLKQQVQELQRASKLPASLTREQRISWAYGNAAIENRAVTMEMVVKAVDLSKPSEEP